MRTRFQVTEVVFGADSRCRSGFSAALYDGRMAHVTAEQRRSQLIRAAIDLMTRKGVAAASTRAVAAELGVAQATVHYVFGSKEELYKAVIEELTREVVDYVREASPPTEGGFGDDLAYMATRLWRTVRDQPSNNQLLIELYVFAVRSPLLRETLEENRRSVNGVAAELIDQAARRAELRLALSAETLAEFFVTGFDGLSLQHMGSANNLVEMTSFHALVSATIALAKGELSLSYPSLITKVATPINGTVPL